MRYQTRHFHRTPRVPCGPSIPSTIPACEAALKQAQADVAAARTPISGTYSPRTYALRQEAIRSAESRVSALQRQLRFLRGEVEEVA